MFRFNIKILFLKVNCVKDNFNKQLKEINFSQIKLFVVLLYFLNLIWPAVLISN